MGQQRRKDNAQRWYCKTCVSDKTGKPWWNPADSKKRTRCGLRKGDCFHSNVQPSAPSKRVQKPPPWATKEKEMKVHIKRLEAECKKRRQLGHVTVR